MRLLAFRKRLDETSSKGGVVCFCTVPFCGDRSDDSDGADGGAVTKQRFDDGYGCAAVTKQRFDDGYGCAVP